MPKGKTDKDVPFWGFGVRGDSFVLKKKGEILTCQRSTLFRIQVLLGMLLFGPFFTLLLFLRPEKFYFPHDYLRYAVYFINVISWIGLLNCLFNRYERIVVDDRKGTVSFWRGRTLVHEYARSNIKEFELKEAKRDISFEGQKTNMYGGHVWTNYIVCIRLKDGTLIEMVETSNKLKAGRFLLELNNRFSPVSG